MQMSGPCLEWPSGCALKLLLRSVRRYWRLHTTSLHLRTPSRHFGQPFMVARMNHPSPRSFIYPQKLVSVRYPRMEGLLCVFCNEDTRLFIHFYKEELKNRPIAVSLLMVLHAMLKCAVPLFFRSKTGEKSIFQAVSCCSIHCGYLT